MYLPARPLIYIYPDILFCRKTLSFTRIYTKCNQMSGEYIETDLHLTDAQRKAIAVAAEGGESARLKFTFKQLEMEGSHKVLLTKTQYAKLSKAFAGKKGLVLTFSKKQIKSLQVGGFLPMLLAGVASALAPTLFSRLFPSSQDGSGINSGAPEEGAGIRLPGGDGIALPGGSGFIDPLSKLVARNALIGANNERALRGMPPIQAPPEILGAGINIPGHGIFYPHKPAQRAGNVSAIQGGNGETITYRGGASFLPDSPVNAQAHKPAGAGVAHMSKKKAPQASGFVAPGTETFQMLQ